MGQSPEDNTHGKTTTKFVSPFRFLQILGGFSGIIIILGLVWTTSAWVTRVETKLKLIEEPHAVNPGVRVSESAGSADWDIVGLMCPMQTPRSDAMTSYDARYFTEYPVCEINEAYGEWDKVGGLPFLGQFLEIESLESGLRARAMVVGTFTDTSHTNRVLVVSPPVVAALVSRARRGIWSVRIRLLDKDEWRKDKKCVTLYRDVYSLGTP